MNCLNDSKRVLGLDIVRSVAILLVLIGHSLDHFILPFTNGMYFPYIISYPLGFLGVELFFVLSGFLIGGILIKEVIEKGTLGSLLNFYIRRWFRTLPLYFLVVLFLTLFPTREEFNWTNLFFIQNFNFNHLQFQPVSWSLSIEEWFYLSIPLIMLLLVGNSFTKNKARNFISTGISIIILILLLRIIVVLFNRDVIFDFGIRKQVYLRLDSIMFGVILSGVKFYYQDIYTKLITKKNFLISFSITGLILCMSFFALKDFSGRDQSFFIKTVFFDIISLFCVLLIYYFDTIKITRIKSYRRIVTLLSKTSFAVYLIHYQVYVIVKSFFRPHNLIHGFIDCLFAVLITFIISYLAHIYYEVPLMNLRDRFSHKYLLKEKVYRKDASPIMD